MTPTPAEIAKAHKRAADIIEHLLPTHRFSAQERAAIKHTLLERARDMGVVEVVLELYSDGTRFQCRVNDHDVRFTGVGLVLAFMAFAGIQYRHEPLRPEWVFTRKRWRQSVLQALDRAAEAVKPLSADLARAINALGVERGLLVLKDNPLVRVRCTLDAELAKMFKAA